MVIESNAGEAGTGDSLRYDVLAQLTAEQLRPWCRWCLQGWQDTLEQKRAYWWAMLDELMGLKSK